MHIEIIEQAHNRVAWQVDTPLVRVEVGLLVGVLLASVILVLVPGASSLRALIIALLIIVGLSAAVFMALTTPLWDRGLVEWLPDGGVVRREQRWLVPIDRDPWEVEMEQVSSFYVEPHLFEETGGRQMALSRLWVVFGEDLEYPLTTWCEPAEVQALAEAAAQAARRSLEEHV
jgi:hypothetical protein